MCVSLLVCYNYHLPVLSGLPLSLVYSCFLQSGDSFRLYPGSSQVFKQTTFARVFQEKGSGSCQSLMSSNGPQTFCHVLCVKLSWNPPTFKGRGRRLHLLTGRTSKNVWIPFPALDVSASSAESCCHYHHVVIIE